MMKHLLALIVKFGIITAALEVVLSYLTNISVINILYISAAVTLLTYIIGDLYILDKTNNTMATIIDVGLALLTVWSFNFFFRDALISFNDALIAALAVGAGEWIYHKFLTGAVFPSLTE